MMRSGYNKSGQLLLVFTKVLTLICQHFSHF
jgi:hypothetical protein